MTRSGLPLVYGFHSFDAVGGDAQRVALRGERCPQYACDLRLVVDDQDLRGLIAFGLLHSCSECCVTMWTSTLGASLQEVLNRPVVQVFAEAV